MPTENITLSLEDFLEGPPRCHRDAVRVGHFPAFLGDIVDRPHLRKAAGGAERVVIAERPGIAHRRRHHHRRAVEESVLQLTRTLARSGTLTGSGVVTWNCAGRKIGNIGVIGDGNTVRLVSTIDGDDIDERIDLTWTDCGFGGQRPWFVCPGCGSRVAILYRDRTFSCRRCCDLRYRSQRDNSGNRAFAKAQEIRVRLGGDANITTPFPGRPRYMHRRKYECLSRQYVDAVRSVCAAFRPTAPR